MSRVDIELAFDVRCTRHGDSVTLAMSGVDRLVVELDGVTTAVVETEGIELLDDSTCPLSGIWKLLLRDVELVDALLVVLT